MSQKLFRYQNKTGYEPWLELPKGELTNLVFDERIKTNNCGEIAKEDDKIVFLRITVPKGKKCIYVPSSESEIIFPRNKELTIGKAELNIFKYPEGYIECLVIPAEMR